MFTRFAAAILCCLPIVVDAQSRPSPQGAAGEPEPSFRSGTELVVLHVSVRDNAGAYVDGLAQEAFHLLENGRPQPVSVFSHQDDPVTIGLIIDVSGSMQATRTRLAYAASQFATSGHPEDEVFALVVGDETRAVLPADAPFTGDPGVLQEALFRALQPGGRTALYDAVLEGLSYLSMGRHERRALVIVSDGLDNASQATFDDVLMRAQASNAAIYAIGLVDPVQVLRDPGHLRRLTRATGGEAYFPKDHQATFGAMEQVAREIRSAYAIGFVPTAPHDGRFHRLRVNVTPPPGVRLKVRTRDGYLAGAR